MVRFHNLYLDLVEAGVDWLAETVKACRRREDRALGERADERHARRGRRGQPLQLQAVSRPGESALGPRDRSARTRRIRTGWRSTTRGGRSATSCSRRSASTWKITASRGWNWTGCAIRTSSSRARPSRLRHVTAWLREVRAVHRVARPGHGQAVCRWGCAFRPTSATCAAAGSTFAASCERGLVDFIGFSNFWQTSWDIRYEQLRAELGPDVVFYGVVEDAPNWVPGHRAGSRWRTAAPGRAPLSERRASATWRPARQCLRAQRGGQTGDGRSRHRAVQFLLHRPAEDPRAARATTARCAAFTTWQRCAGAASTIACRRLRPAFDAVGDAGADLRR